MFWHKIKARCFVLGVLELGEFIAWNTLTRFDIRLLLQQNIAENCMTWQKVRKVTEQLWQFVGHSQNYELSAKRESHRKIAAAR